MWGQQIYWLSIDVNWNMHDIISRKIIQSIEMSGVTSVFGKCVFVCG